MTTPRFLVSAEALSGTRTVLTGAELHHVRVRRLRTGSELILSDGRGQQRAGIIAALDRHGAVVHFAAAAPSGRESRRHLVLALALLKGNKLDLVTEKSTELGIDELLFFRCERSLGQASPARQARWSRIARAAAKQSQRSTVPIVAGPITFDELLTRSDPLRLLFWEGSSAGRLAMDALPPVQAGSVLAAVGPEGGFTKAEAARAVERGFWLVGLGARILRAETAALVAATLCQFLWGDLARPEP